MCLLLLESSEATLFNLHLRYIVTMVIMRKHKNKQNTLNNEIKVTKRKHSK